MHTKMFLQSTMNLPILILVTLSSYIDKDLHFDLIINIQYWSIGRYLNSFASRLCTIYSGDPVSISVRISPLYPLVVVQGWLEWSGFWGETVKTEAHSVTAGVAINWWRFLPQWSKAFKHYASKLRPKFCSLLIPQ